MRLNLIPLMFAVILAVGPATIHANTNQAAAEKIAASLGDRFPGYDIAVSYQNGKVQLVGQVISLDMMHSTLEHVQRVPGIAVTEIDNGLQVNPRMRVQPTPAQRSVAVASIQTEPAAAPATEKSKRSIFSPQPNARLASAPVPMPQRAVVVQAANREMSQPTPLETAPPQQLAPMMAPPAGGQYVGGTPMHHHGMQAGMPQGMQPAQGLPQGAYHPEAYGPQGPMPGQYNQPNLPDYAWPSYAAYPNYAEVCYPRQYSPKAWPHIGPFYPYPQVPLGWRKVALEWHDGWWWLDFDDGTPTGPFSPLFRQPVRYTY